MPDSRFLHPSSPSPSPKPTSSTATSTTSDSTPPQAQTPLTSDHPLSPSLSRRTLSKRASSFHTHKPTTGDTAEGYFDLEPSTRTRRHAATISSTGIAGTDDLLGMATGTHASSRIDLFDNVSGARRQSETLSRIDSLSKEEAAVVEMRFDLMSEGEVEMYLRTMCPPRSRSGSNSTTSTSSSSSSSPRAISSLATPRLITPTEVISPTTPRAQFAKRPFVPTPSSSDKTPLFPPSPRSKKARRPDHPLRILSRAVRELKESVEHLEEENARLKHELELALGKRPSRDVEADTASIHDDLTEALSTSLTSSPLRYAKSTQSYPASTYAPSIASRPKSPSSISIPYPSSPKIPPPSAREPPAGASDTGRRSANRASWTSGFWVWNKTKPRPRKGSAGSTSSQVSSLFPGATTRPVPEGAIAEDEDDEHAWRKGDGGSPPSFRAIFLATRIITPDPSSILTSSNTPNSLIAYLAHALVSSARDEGITAKDPPGRRTSRSRAVSVASQEAPPPVGDIARDGKGYGDQALAVGRSLFSSVSNATLRGKSALATSTTEDKPRPSLLSRASSSRAFPTTAISPPVERGNVSASTPEEPELPSVEMDAVVADENRPPTVLLSRQNIGSFFQSTKTGTTKLSTASRFKSDQPPLTDRYGFIYDIQHASMLKDASAAGTVAPASLNGIHPVAEVEEGWIEKQRRKSIQSSRSPSSDSLDRVASRTRASIDSSRSDRATERPQTPESRAGSTTPGSKSPEVTTPSAPAPRSSSLVDTVGRHRSPSNLMNNLNPSSARAITAKDHLTVSARGASSLVSLVTSPTLPHSATMETTEVASTAPSAAASRATLSSLLDKLTENHDRQQKERKVLWDAFLRKRSRHRSNTLDGRGGGGEGGEGNGAIGIIGVNEMGIRGKKGEDDYKAFLRLVRGGIPLAYRSDIWAECSGAKDLFVPGEYAEILKNHANEQSPVEADIEKDVSRTFPGNVFFGGDGPGVAKLRRVLVAYSWHNPSVGYCQGMNMLAATLLLTHTDEEQAYWTLQAIVERLLPESFYSPDLLASRADQMVLADLVGQLVPRVHGHLEELGVDLASVTFGWFLSLFTDCLPVETLFRVWDVFFVEGRDTLFRVAVAILKLNEGDILDTTSVSDLFALMSGMTSRLWTADKLIQVQHSYKPIIKGGDVDAKFQKHLANLRAE